MLTRFFKIHIVNFMAIGILMLISSQLAAQKNIPSYRLEEPYLIADQYSQAIFNPENITKKPGHYTITDWDEAIDNTWGWGLPKAQKLQILNTFWETIDEEFACFVNHPDYHIGWWDSLRTAYTHEIDNGNPTYGVSRGRFAAIMNYLSMALKDSHTRAKDKTVNLYTVLQPGIPLLVPGPYGPCGHFGAGLTPLADSSLLVYKTVAFHPLGLEPGDIVLGYDGIPWKQLYKDLLDAQLPIYFGLGWGNRWGSSESAFAHSWLTSAGMNWHLFDSLDVVKYNTGDTIRISVSPLIGQNMDIFCSEQMEIPGVPMPDLDAGERSSFGIIGGTQIGYIYVWSWSDNIENEFNEAIRILMNEYETTGLIIDLRLDYWGWMHLANKGFAHLFNTREPLFQWVERLSSTNHLSLRDIDFSYFDNIYGAAFSYYDKPIAILTGPGSFSVGDFIAAAVKFHPMARTFGKPVTGAFNYFISLDLGNSLWECNYSNVNTYYTNNPGNYLVHTELEVDEDVWLTPDDVALGYDTVVEAARSWINSQHGTQPDIAIDHTDLEIMLDYGETASESLVVSNNGNRTLFYSITPGIDSGSVCKSGSNLSIAGHDGYDAFGYTWIDSDQPHGPSFNWVDISGIGTPVILGDNSYAGPIDIGFNFPFYGSEYSDLYICSNGLITFGSGSASYANVHIPDSNYPNNFIAPWWDNLNPGAGGNIYYYIDSIDSVFIVSFINVPKYNYGGHTTFQTILDSYGHIKFNYMNMELGLNAFLDFYSSSVGIENVDGSDGLEIYYNAPYTIDSLSILITTDWLAISPSSSYIAPGGNEIVTITFNAQHLNPGIYTGGIYLDSNDPVDSCIVIPVTLEVAGLPYLPGDANMYNGSWPPAVIGSDVTYLVNYFRGMPTNQACLVGANYVAADVNASCTVIGSDVTRLVNYFRGQGEIEYCPDWEPLWHDDSELPADAPAGWPNCEAPAVTSNKVETSDNIK